MICPGCRRPMTEHTLEAHMGASVTVDACVTCQSFWFDGRESLQLTPASTLRLFRVIGDAAGAERRPLPSVAACPRCALRLQPVQDMQRNTRFRYGRCPRGHGRFITFFDFLREKHFVRTLTAQQLADLRAHLQTVNCANCGAPVDLQAGSACGHCGSPLSLFDAEHAQHLLEQFRQADARPRTDEATLALDLLRARRDAERAFADLDTSSVWSLDVPTALRRWLGRLV